METTRQNFTAVTINGGKALAKFKANYDCLNLSLAVMHLGNIRYLKCLVPHGESLLELGNTPSEAHIWGAIAHMDKVVKDGLLDETGYYFTPDNSGHYQWVQPDGDITALSVDQILDIIWKTNSFKDRLEGYLSEPFKCYSQQMEQRAVQWRVANEGYLKSKASEYADLWTKNLGTLGSSGSSQADYYHSRLQSQVASNKISTEDVGRFKEAVFEYALEQFRQGLIPRLATDYQPMPEMARLLRNKGLGRLSSQLPWKTWFQLDYSDCPT